MSTKATKSAAHYGPGMTAARCGICAHFRPPHGCTEVEGEVAAGGWCRFFRKAAGVATKPPARSPQSREEHMARRAQQAGQRGAARDFGVSQSTVSRRMLRDGYERKGKA